MIPGLILFFAIAIFDWVAVARKWNRVEFIAKPLAMVVLIGLLLFEGGLRNLPLICFTAGIILSLAGDIFLMINTTGISKRWFILGLVAFLLAHVAYIAGLNIPLPDVSPLWSMGLAIVLSLTVARFLRQIISSIRKNGMNWLVIPVGIYATIITLMLLSALLTLSRSDWSFSAAGLVSLGALLFYTSDLLLAWDRFVSPVKNGRLVNMISYHLGQVGLVIGILLQFGQ
jgi:uncharacterized membrane protein YhhN